MTSTPIGLDLAGGRELLARRRADRRVTMLGIAIAAGYLVLAVAAALLAPPAMRMGVWLPLHLLLAGAAATAIAGVMPFFGAGVASVPPAPTWVRLLGVVGVALGAALVVVVRLAGRGAIDNAALGAVAGTTYLVGIGAVATATMLPLRAALRPRRQVLAVAYGAALASVAVGALIGTLAIAGWSPALGAWGVLRPTHAWLNVMGFLSLVIATSLLHLLPTVVGARIERTRASDLVLGGLMVGPAVVALGFVLRVAPMVAAGALLVVVAAASLAWHAVTVFRRRGRWRSDLAWHRFVQWSLLASVGWFAVGVAIAGAVAVGDGPVARRWDSEAVIGPIALGWAAQALVGASSHLVPAVGPGSPQDHADQRAALGRWATARVVLAQAGVALVSVGLPTGMAPMAQAGLAIISSCGVVAAILLGTALRIVVRRSVAPVALDRGVTMRE